MTARPFVSHPSPRGGTGQLGPVCLGCNYDVFFLNVDVFLLLSISNTDLYREQSYIYIFSCSFCTSKTPKTSLCLSPED